MVIGWSLPASLRQAHERRLHDRAFTAGAFGAAWTFAAGRFGAGTFATGAFGVFAGCRVLEESLVPAAPVPLWLVPWRVHGRGPAGT
ncbi:hypothetical protein ABZ904_49775 [Streptomyces sp. NPDC046900]|uniref:hypothetical protein n=1 Tax=Streptomyces sp. NPDC046900 TaxID=3155473 RepID=UPI0033EE8A48